MQDEQPSSTRPIRSLAELRSEVRPRKGVHEDPSMVGRDVLALVSSGASGHRGITRSHIVDLLRKGGGPSGTMWSVSASLGLEVVIQAAQEAGVVVVMERSSGRGGQAILFRSVERDHALTAAAEKFARNKAMLDRPRRS